jgi:hypothetical protein
MPAQPSTSSHHERAIASLAHETDTSVDEITRLCTTEYARLAIDARLTSYLAIFAFRGVQAVLRSRHAASLAFA